MKIVNFQLIHWRLAFSSSWLNGLDGFISHNTKNSHRKLGSPVKVCGLGIDLH